MKKLTVKMQKAITIGICILLGMVTLIVVNQNKAPESVATTQSATTSTNTDTIEMFDPAPDIELTSLGQFVNDERGKAGLQPLTRDPLLDKSAQEKCDDMVAKDYWSHDAPDGSTPWDFIKKYNVYSVAGENLAYGWRDASSIVAGWMNSPEHRKNILDGDFTNVGYAQCKSNNYQAKGKQTIVVQHLANAPIN